ncbi:MAG: tRNA pseudouridine(13) synthase TruD, partial [Chloroflexota bacterium]
ELEQAVLKEENVDSEDFRIDVLPGLAERGGLRAALVPLKDFAIESISRDVAEPSKWMCRVSFVLCRGSYATVVLRELMKPRDLIGSGF